MYDVVNRILLCIILTDHEFRELKKGNAELFKMIYLAYKKDIYNFLIIKCRGDVHSAEDILSEAMISAYKALSTLKHRENLQSWLIKIAHRRFYDYRRKYFQDRKILEKLKEREVHEQKTTVDCNSELVMQEKAVLLDLALNAINPDYKRILELKIFEKKKIKEIASLLQRTEKAIENMIFRAKKALKKEMKTYAHHFEDTQ
jgi:RNA polymerase sigma factor (sigma-70 family)